MLCMTCENICKLFLCFSLVSCELHTRRHTAKDFYLSSHDRCFFLRESLFHLVIIAHKTWRSSGKEEEEEEKSEGSPPNDFLFDALSSDNMEYIHATPFSSPLTRTLISFDKFPVFLPIYSFDEFFIIFYPSRQLLEISIRRAKSGKRRFESETQSPSSIGL